MNPRQINLKHFMMNDMMTLAGEVFDPKPSTSTRRSHRDRDICWRVRYNGSIGEGPRQFSQLLWHDDDDDCNGR